MSPDRETPLWEPTPAERERAWLTGFKRWAGEREGRTFADYEQLRQWSVTELEGFWASIWEYFGVRCSRPYERVLDSHAMPGARWFGGAELNYAENMLCVRHTGAERGSGPADDGREGGPQGGREGRSAGGRDPNKIAVLHASDRSRETRASGPNPRFGQRWHAHPGGGRHGLR